MTVSLTLWHSPNSPYGRKVMVSAHEKGVADRVTVAVPAMAAGTLDPQVSPVNPLGKIPAARTADGRRLFDSRVICAFLDSLDPARPLVPPARRFEVLTMEALGDGVMDAALALRGEAARPEALRWDRATALQTDRIAQALDSVEGDWTADGTEAEADLGLIALGCALAYIDHRLPAMDWRRDRPRLTRWHAAFSRRPSMVATAH